MTLKATIAFVLFLLAAVLAVVAAFVPPVQGRLLAFAVAAVALGLAVQAWS